MPNEPMTEPTLEQLSGFLDHELDAETQARVAEHVAGCADCQSRLEGLRQTAYAIRALPMETPPRSFTIPPQPERQSRWRWAPAGWIGAVAVFLVVALIGSTHLHFGPGPEASTASRSVSGGLGTGTQQAAAPTRAAAPLAEPDQYAGGAAKAAVPSNSTTVADPYDSSRTLTVATTAASYPSSGVLVIRVSTSGLSASEASSVRLWLQQDRGRGGYAIRLSPPVDEPSYPASYNAAYSISQMSLPAPVLGSYTVIVQIQLSGGSSLIAELPIMISS